MRGAKEAVAKLLQGGMEAFGDEGGNSASWHHFYKRSAPRFLPASVRCR